MPSQDHDASAISVLSVTDGRSDVAKQLQVDPNYMDAHQPNLTWQMRSILVDWIIHLLGVLSRGYETLYLAVKIVDMYLSSGTQAPLAKNRLQLLGMSAILVASEHKDGNPVKVHEVVEIVGNYCSTDEITSFKNLIMEVVDVKTLAAKPSSSGVLRSLVTTQMQPGEWNKLLYLARYIMESSLLDHTFLGHNESELAAGALFLAQVMILGEDVWDERMARYSGVDREAARQMALKFNAMLRKPPMTGDDGEPVQHVKEKYTLEKFLNVTKIPLVEDEVV